MTTINMQTLKDLPLEKLSEIVEIATKQLEEKKEGELLDSWKSFVQKAAELAMDVEAALNLCYKKQRQARVVPIKYQDPSNLDNVWSGRGKTPNWLSAYEAKGRKKEEFLIS